MGLLNLRNALMTGKRLPYDAEIEYLESTGTQWIDTGYAFNTGTDVLSIVYQNTSAMSHKWLWGSYEAGAQVGCSSATISAPTVWYKDAIPVEEDAQYNSPHILIYDAHGVSNDGTVLNSFKSFVGTYNLYLYALNYDNSSVPSSRYFGYGRIYGYQHRRNGVIVRDFIPVRRGTVGYLYDRVSRRLFGNAGTGNFTLGPDVVPVEYIRAENNTSATYKFINTGVTPTQNTKWELRAAFTRDPTVAASIIGMYGGSYGQFDIGVQAGGAWLFNRGETTSGGVADDKWHTFVLDGPNNTGFVDGVATVTLGNTFTYQTGLETGTICLFCRGRGDRTPPIDITGSASVFVDMDIASSRIWGTTGNLIQSLRAVRVGTGSTWEGAMMDVLTRKVYRNAGTGAFTYGNDLKYPIPSDV